MKKSSRIVYGFREGADTAAIDAMGSKNDLYAVRLVLAPEDKAQQIRMRILGKKQAKRLDELRKEALFKNKCRSRSLSSGKKTGAKFLKFQGKCLVSAEQFQQMVEDTISRAVPDARHKLSKEADGTLVYTFDP